jgi:23S rRNA (uracil1939-C5)-methyltransferase
VATTCVVEATALDEHGHGVGPAGDRTVHVADLLPGERADVGIDHRSPHGADSWGHVVRRIGKPSPDRVAPACPRFGRCGGCPWQHLAYDAQLREKHRAVAAALAGVPAVEARAVTVAPVVPSPAQLGYRNKGKYVAAAQDGRLVLGAYVPRTHEVIDTLGCKVVAPVIDEVATWARGALDAAGLAPFHETRRTGELRYVVIRASAAGDALVALVVASATPRKKLEQVANAMSHHPALRGLVAVTNDRRDGAILPSGSPAAVLAGTGVLVERVAGVDVEVGAGEFLQVNRAQAARLYARVAELAAPAPGARVADVYAGLGGITFALAAQGADVVALELDPEAVAGLRRAATRAGLDRVRAETGDAAGLAAALAGAGCDVVVVNPPRKGLSEAALDAVVAAGPARIVYVSCGPATLGRDLVRLEPRGYVATAIEPFDLMPGTAQVETVVRIDRRG